MLTGGELLQLWHQNITPFQEEHSKYIFSWVICFNLIYISVEINLAQLWEITFSLR